MSEKEIIICLASILLTMIALNVWRTLMTTSLFNNSQPDEEEEDEEEVSAVPAKIQNTIDLINSYDDTPALYINKPVNKFPGGHDIELTFESVQRKGYIGVDVGEDSVTVTNGSEEYVFFLSRGEQFDLMNVVGNTHTSVLIAYRDMLGKVFVRDYFFGHVTVDELMAVTSSGLQTILHKGDTCLEFKVSVENEGSERTVVMHVPKNTFLSDITEVKKNDSEEEYMVIQFDSEEVDLSKINSLIITQDGQEKKYVGSEYLRAAWFFRDC